jgi:hypothetical protein
MTGILTPEYMLMLNTTMAISSAYKYNKLKKLNINKMEEKIQENKEVIIKEEIIEKKSDNIIINSPKIENNKNDISKFLNPPPQAQQCSE